MGFFSASSWAAKETRKDALPHCGECGLSKKCFSPRMPVTGKGRRKVLFVGEAPGQTEDRKGEQLIGDAGQLLRKVLRELHVDLEDCWKTNAVICRPEENKIDDVYIEACRPNLLKTVAELHPKVIVLLGMSAVKGLLRGEWTRDIGTMGRWAGWTIPNALHNAWVCPTYHPSYVKRMDEDPLLMRILRDHLGAALALEDRKLQCVSVQSLKDQVEVITNPPQARLRMRDLAGKEGYLAFDYETTGLKPDRAEQEIVCCSFCLNGEDTFACMIDERARSALSAVLRSERLLKIGSNNKFEERWTLKKLGHPVAAWAWDTMIGAHVLDNRPDITSVKFQAYVLLGVPDYETHVSKLLKADYPNDMNQIRKIHPEDVLLYCGLDSLLEYKVAELQWERIGWKP